MKDINAASDLMETYTKSLIVAAAMTFFGMHDATDDPQHNNFDFSVHQDRKSYVMQTLSKIVDQYVIPSSDELSTQAPQFQCSHCRKSYKTKRGLQKHTKASHTVLLSALTSQQSLVENTQQDDVFNYVRCAASMGLLALNFMDARRLGDGERVLQIYKYLLLHFKAAGKPKYSFQVLRLLAQVNWFLSPQLSYSLKWNRFVNKTGKATGNIEMDREMEHHNRIFKTQCKAMRGKISAKSVERVSHSAQVVDEILYGIDKHTSFKRPSGKHASPDNKKDIIALAMQMLSSKIFEHQPGRISSSFPGYPPSVFGCLNLPDMLKWIKTTLKTLSRQHILGRCQITHWLIASDKHVVDCD